MSRIGKRKASKPLKEKNEENLDEVDSLKKLFSEPITKVKQQEDSSNKADQYNEVLNEYSQYQHQQLNNIYKPYINESDSAYASKQRAERTVFVENINTQANNKDVLGIFRQYGKIEKLWKRKVTNLQTEQTVINSSSSHKTLKPSQDKVEYYILFEQKSDAEKSLAANGTIFQGNYLRVDWAEQKQMDFKTTIFVGGLSLDTSEEDLRQFFENSGPVAHVKVLRNLETHIGKGCGYVYFRTHQAFENAFSLKNQQIKGRKIRIWKAEQPHARDQIKETKEQRKQQERRDQLEQKELKDVEEDLEEFAKTQNTEIPLQENDVLLVNSTKISPNLIKKKINKLIRNKGVDRFVATQKILTKLTKKNDDELFKETLEWRAQNKKKRDQKEETNRKKAKSSKNKLRQDKIKLKAINVDKLLPEQKKAKETTKPAPKSKSKSKSKFKNKAK